MPLLRMKGLHPSNGQTGLSVKTLYKKDLLRIVEEPLGNLGKTILLIEDELDETTVSLDVEQVEEIIPVLKTWLHAQKVGAS